jgi:hypothetical protein
MVDRSETIPAVTPPRPCDVIGTARLDCFPRYYIGLSCAANIGMDIMD